MPNPIKLSIIIVNYNVKDFLSQCLVSIKQSNVNFNYEIIVVDNNSSDGSAEFIEKFFPEVKIVRMFENKGFGYANNVGFSHSQGDYLLLLNPDTILQENTLQVMIDFMERNPEVGIAGCKVLNSNGSLQLACRRGFPTPWVAFTKLFGLQALFPKSKLFGRYNLTYLDPDQIAYVDAISGSFMFVRREVYNVLQGFDTDFFMYGEDIDFCYRAQKLGWKIAYVPTTSIIHYKGQSTRRSTIDETYFFFKSMEIFARKHFSDSRWFAGFIRFGILVRQFISKLLKFRTEILFIITDLLFANLSLGLASWIRFGSVFSFPDYAYPTVFLALSFVVFFSMIAVGEYFEFEHSVWRASFGLLVSFFVLSSLTYFFKEYAFSRGVLLLTIGFSLIFFNATRIVYNLRNKIKGSLAPRRIAFLGDNDITLAIINELEKNQNSNAQVVGLISTEQGNLGNSIPVIGNYKELPVAIKSNQITEIIVTDPNISRIDLLKVLQKTYPTNVRLYYAQVYEDYVASEIIRELTNANPVGDRYNLTRFRQRFFKRVFDLALLLWFFTIGFPFLFLFFDKGKRKIVNFLKILVGEMTFVGLDKEYREFYDKEPLVTISEAHRGAFLTPRTKEKLNQFYIKEYSPLLDLEILFKYRKGKNGKSSA